MESFQKHDCSKIMISQCVRFYLIEEVRKKGLSTMSSPFSIVLLILPQMRLILFGTEINKTAEVIAYTFTNPSVSLIQYLHSLGFTYYHYYQTFNAGSISFFCDKTLTDFPQSLCSIFRNLGFCGRNTTVSVQFTSFSSNFS